MKIRTLGTSPNFLPQSYPQDLWIIGARNPGTCGPPHMRLYYAPFWHQAVHRRTAMKAICKKLTVVAGMSLLTVIAHEALAHPRRIL